MEYNDLKKFLNVFLAYFFKNSTYGIRVNSFQDAKRFKYAFL